MAGLGGPMGFKAGGAAGHHFSQVPTIEGMSRSRFDRSHRVHTTFNSGLLIPFYADEALPGDTVDLAVTSFVRLQTVIHPYMDDIRLTTFFFAVPNRLLWTNWERFNGAQDNPADSISYTVPIITAATWAESSLGDYLGFPTKISVAPNAWWTRAYNFIYNTWYRDEDLQNSVTFNTGDGPDTAANYVLLRRGKRHDYFTSCRPWPQKGAAVTLPLGTQAPIKGIGTHGQTFGGSSVAMYETIGGAPRTYTYYNDTSTAATVSIEGTAASGGYPKIYADLTNATAATINALRLAFQTQKLLERDARGGTRYVEQLKVRWGVSSPDYRMQRPEYLGGGVANINVHPVPQTAATSGANYAGMLSGFGTGSGRDGFTKSFTEHCTLIGMICVDAELSYQQGLERQFTRQTRYDFATPELMHIGEQAVLNQEIYYANNGASGDTLTFGYQGRYDEYRYKPSRVSGQMRSNATTPLDMWHLSENFGSLPVLGATWIQSAPPIARIVADTTDAQFYGDFYFDLKVTRLMPTFSVPGLMDHF